MLAEKSDLRHTIELIVSKYDIDTNMKPDLVAHCPIARSLQCAGDAWSMLILRDAFAGLTRFDQFRKSLGIAPTILAARLAALTDEGLLEKRRYETRPPRDEYLLTKAGQDFLPVLVMLGAWGSAHRSGGALTRFIDVQTGGQIDPIAVDRHTGAEIGTRPMQIMVPSVQGGGAPRHPPILSDPS